MNSSTYSTINRLQESMQFQNHPKRYEKLICFHSYTATTNEKFLGSSQRGLVSCLIQFKCTKYFRHDLTRVLEDTERRSRNPKVRVLIPLEPTLVVAV